MMRYETYKDTAIDWLGKIPATWNVERIKNIGSVNGRVGWKALKAAEYVESGFFFLSTPNIKDVEIDFVKVNYITAERYYESPEIMLEVGDILLVKDGSTLGIVNVIRYLPAKGTVNSSIAVLRIKKFHAVYGYYFLLSNYIQNVIQLKKDGMGVPHLFQKDINNFEILVPSLEEQTAIANYLDTKTQAIDKKISLLDKKIGYYQELRKSLINETVTKGLDKNVKLKESGIDWIGQIPEHWEVKRLKDIAHVNQRNLPENTPSDYSFTYIDIANFDSSGEEIQSIEFKDAPSRARRIIKKGDVIISTVRTYLKAIAVFDFDVSDTIVSTGFAVLTARKLIAPKFLGFLVRAESLVDKVAQLSSGVSYPAINASTLISIEIVIPPQEEQIQIADYLEQKTSTIAKIITNLQTQITTLKELRKTLINDVVTGKIKVIQD